MEGDTAEFQFDFQALLVDFFRQPLSLLVIHLKGGAHEFVAFIFVNLRFHKVQDR